MRQVPLGPQGQLIYGTLTAGTADTLYLSVPNTQGSLAIPRASVRSLAVSNGLPTRRRSILVNGIRGAALGAAEFYLLYAVRNDRDFGSHAGAAFAGVGVGFAFGAFLGARRPVEQWREVPLQSTASNR